MMHDDGDMLDPSNWRAMGTCMFSFIPQKPIRRRGFYFVPYIKA